MAATTCTPWLLACLGLAALCMVPRPHCSALICCQHRTCGASPAAAVSSACPAAGGRAGAACARTGARAGRTAARAEPAHHPVAAAAHQRDIRQPRCPACTAWPPLPHPCKMAITGLGMRQAGVSSCCVFTGQACQLAPVASRSAAPFLRAQAQQTSVRPACCTAGQAQQLCVYRCSALPVT